MPRTKLAAAIERHQEATETLTRYRSGAERARAATIDATGAIMTAEAVLAEAQSDQPHAYVSALLSGQPPGAGPVERAERALTEAKAQSAFARDGEEALKREITAIANRAQATRAGRDEALREVVASSSAVAALWADFQATNCHLATLNAVLTVLGQLRLPKAAQNWDAIRDWLADPASADAWRAALAALADDPDAPLPGDA